MKWILALGCVTAATLAGLSCSDLDCEDTLTCDKPSQQGGGGATVGAGGGGGLGGGGVGPTAGGGGTGTGMGGAGGTAPVDYESISAGEQHTCAVSDTNGLWCWGANAQGQLGSGDNANSPVPVSVPLAVDVVAAGNAHTCAVDTSGVVHCWGANDDGQLGNNSTTDSSVPVVVQGLSGAFVDACAGDGHSCAARDDGQVYCWGRNNRGQLQGDGDSLVAKPVVGFGAAVEVTCGEEHTCARSGSGSVVCWGSNVAIDGAAVVAGQLGHGMSSPLSKTVVNVTGVAGAQAVAAGRFHTCATTTSNTSCWGFNAAGQVGPGGNTSELSPVILFNLGGGEQVTAGFNHSCVLQGLQVSCWGMNQDGQLGNDSSTSSPSPVSVLGVQATALDAGGRHTCGVLASGRATCWGRNEFGQLGDGTMDGSLVAVTVVEPQ
jgi:alpha-tubulin suppressor-like RCC1 family protein